MAAKHARVDEGHRIVDARYVASTGPEGTLPAPASVEIAFAGRSNVGKSSLVNTLVERKGLVRTSSTPGSTRQINLFEARAKDGVVLGLVDLPGYGFTRRSKSETAAWKSLVEGYMAARPTLAAVVLLVDVRRGVEDDDRELIEFVESIGSATTRAAGRRGIEVVVVATKIDKLPRAGRRPALDRIAKTAGRRAYGFSATTGEGRDELWAVLRRAAAL